MENAFFIAAGVFILILACWFGTALFRIMRAPEKLLNRWRHMTPEDTARCAKLCELFFQEELHTPIHKENPLHAFPKLADAFPGSIHRLQAFLLCGTPVRDERGKVTGFKKSSLYYPGEYFYGYSSILLSSFIGEALRLRCGGRWIPSAGGPLLLLPGKTPGSEVIVSPVRKLADLRNIACRADQEQFKEYLLELSSYSPQ